MVSSAEKLAPIVPEKEITEAERIAILKRENIMADTEELRPIAQAEERKEKIVKEAVGSLEPAGPYAPSQTPPVQEVPLTEYKQEKPDTLAEQLSKLQKENPEQYKAIKAMLEQVGS